MYHGRAIAPRDLRPRHVYRFKSQRQYVKKYATLEAMPSAVFYTLLLSVILKVSREDCPSITLYNLTVWRTVDGPVETASSANRIELKDDAFHLALVNETIPRLCQGSVYITNELSVLQILRSGLVELDPKAFEIVPTLALLKISFNLLTTVKSGVFNAVRVKELDLSNNFISVIDEEAFDNNTDLEILKLNYNAVKELSPNWFRNSPKVYKLSVIYNELRRLPSGVFRNLNKRRDLKLRLSANKISDIDAGAFDGVGNIDILRLNGNKLLTLPPQVFTNRTIRILQVNTNDLVCFPDEFYSSKIESLWFLENPRFNCTCLKKVKEFVDRNEVDIMYPAIICEDRVREINLVFNFNKTYELPLLPPNI